MRKSWLVNLKLSHDLLWDHPIPFAFAVMVVFLAIDNAPSSIDQKESISDFVNIFNSFNTGDSVTLLLCSPNTAQAIQPTDATLPVTPQSHSSASVSQCLSNVSKYISHGTKQPFDSPKPTANIDMASAGVMCDVVMMVDCGATSPTADESKQHIEGGEVEFGLPTHCRVHVLAFGVEKDKVCTQRETKILFLLIKIYLNQHHTVTNAFNQLFYQ
jgi:hypothetical protein